MQSARSFTPSKMARWEIWTLAGIVVLCLVLAFAGRDERQARAYQDFVRRAKMIERGLRLFAADYDGRFPPDGLHTYPPPALGRVYVPWDPAWGIDYEAHPNGDGGFYVCLEYSGPGAERVYRGLCAMKENRGKYGRGEPIPGLQQRIWLIEEDAPVMDWQLAQDIRNGRVPPRRPD